MKRILKGLFAPLLFFISTFTVSLQLEANETVYDRDPVNGHSGYLSAWRVRGNLDKPIVIVKGYDNSNDDHPIDDFDVELGVLTEPLTESGFDIIIFDYVNGTADLKQNADNLASFIRDLDGIFRENGLEDLDNDGHPDYELSVVSCWRFHGGYCYPNHVCSRE